MGQDRYVISEVVNKTNLKPHTIRYWEDELGLTIDRDNMDHRRYSDNDIKLFLEIKELKDKGFQLKAIKTALAGFGELENIDDEVLEKIREHINQSSNLQEYEGSALNKEIETINIQSNVISGGDDVSQNEIMTSQEARDKQEVVINKSDKMEQFREILHNLIVDAMKENNQELADTVTNNVTDSVIKEMDCLFRIKEEREEERFKKLDEMIREVQKSRLEIAATDTRRKKKRLFHK